MQVILLEKIDNLGNLGDLVDVKSGFARNFLFPQTKAEPATKANIEAFNVRRAELEKLQQEALSAAEQRKAKLDGQVITISSKAGAEGKLFGSIGTDEICEAVSKIGVAVEKREVRLSEGPLRAVGEHEVVLHLHAAVDSTITVEVVPEEE